MAIKRHKRGDRVYVSEYKQIRKGKDVKSVFLRYLGTENRIKEGERPKRRVLDRIQLSQSHRAGDVRLLWEISKDLDFIGIIDRICCQEFNIQGSSPGKFLTVWAINRVIDPESCTQLERWVPTTDLPILTGIDPEFFTKDAFLSSLDFVCYHDSATHRLIDHTTAIEDILYQRWRSKHPLPPGDKESVAYDLTSVLFFGVNCPIAELGHNTKNVKRRQVNLALLVSKYDKYPIAHFVYNGCRHTSSTVKNLFSWLMDTSIEPGTIIWDRGNVSKEYVNIVESTGWKLICGVPKTANDVLDVIDVTDVPLNPSTFTHKSKLGHIYAVKIREQLFGKNRSLVVYVNQDLKVSKVNAQNEALAEIGNELDTLSEKGKNWSEAELHKEINTILGSWKDYVYTQVNRKGDGTRIKWRYKKQEIARVERSYGKNLLLSTDETLSAKEVVKSYFEKDYIEKVFRILKTNENIEPVRHRLESHVRAYMFVCVLAYRLLAVLRSLISEMVGDEKAWERTFELLHDLSRVERVEVGFGREVKTWYLNTTKESNDLLKKIGFKNLFKEETRLRV
jgi:transposase